MTSFYFNLFSPYFLQLYCPNGISPMGKWGYFPQEKPAVTGLRYPTYGACWLFCCLNKPLNSGMDYQIFNLHIDVNACDFTGWCMVCKGL